MSIQVECINKYPRQDPHRHITHIGGRNPDGTRWKLTEEAAIQGIREGKWDFYVQVGTPRQCFAAGGGVGVCVGP